MNLKFYKGIFMASAISVDNDGLLYIQGNPVQFIENKIDKFSPGVNTKEFIIVHYTASTTAKSAHNNYLDPNTEVSWHLTIDRDGVVYQVLEFDKIAWHAGQSEWMFGTQKYVGMNKYSIGIEHSNAGPLTEKGGSYCDCYGHVIPNVDVFFDNAGNPWQRYSDAQLAASRVLVLELAKLWRVKDILSHQMIAPMRKLDTGPAYQQQLDSMRQEYRNWLTSNPF